jgi:uncharacterized protein (TIGR03382 family)
MIGFAAALALQTLYTDHGDPTAAEQRVLEIINRARANPDAEEARLLSLSYTPAGWTIREGLTGPEMADVGPRPPLAMNGRLLTAARAHSLDMRTRAFFAHVNPDGAAPEDRVAAAGYAGTSSENIAMSTNGTAEYLENILMIDEDYSGRGHRKALLDINSSSTTYMREIGIGHHAAATGVVIPPNDPMWLWKDFITQEFGRTATQPFLLGVAYLDANNNSFYDEGEGLGGVSLTPSSGSFRAVTASAGGYAFPTAASGGINVTASGSNLPADVVAAVTLSSNNQKLDVRVAGQADSDIDGLPDYWEMRFGGSLAPGVDTDNDTFTNMQEFRGGSDPTSASSTPAPPPPPPPATVGGDDDDGDGGGCGCTGWEALLALAAASWLRRRTGQINRIHLSGRPRST